MKPTTIFTALLAASEATANRFSRDAGVLERRQTSPTADYPPHYFQNKVYHLSVQMMESLRASTESCGRLTTSPTAIATSHMRRALSSRGTTSMPRIISPADRCSSTSVERHREQAGLRTCRLAVRPRIFKTLSFPPLRWRVKLICDCDSYQDPDGSCGRSGSYSREPLLRPQLPLPEQYDRSP